MIIHHLVLTMSKGYLDNRGADETRGQSQRIGAPPPARWPVVAQRGVEGGSGAAAWGVAAECAAWRLDSSGRTRGMASEINANVWAYQRMP
jgi:hypothetical protein